LSLENVHTITSSLCPYLESSEPRCLPNGRRRPGCNHRRSWYPRSKILNSFVFTADGTLFRSGQVGLSIRDRFRSYLDERRQIYDLTSVPRTCYPCRSLSYETYIWFTSPTWHLYAMESRFEKPNKEPRSSQPSRSPPLSLLQEAGSS
jgi:hypothetical protein